MNNRAALDAGNGTRSQVVAGAGSCGRQQPCSPAMRQALWEADGRRGSAPPSDHPDQAIGPPPRFTMASTDGRIGMPAWKSGHRVDG